MPGKIIRMQNLHPLRDVFFAWFSSVTGEVGRQRVTVVRLWKSVTHCRWALCFSLSIRKMQFSGGHAFVCLKVMD